MSDQLILSWFILIWTLNSVKSPSFPIWVRLVLCHFLFYSDCNLCSYLRLFDLFPVSLHGSIPYPVYTSFVFARSSCVFVSMIQPSFVLPLLYKQSFTEFRKFIFCKHLCFRDYHVSPVCLFVFLGAGLNIEFGVICLGLVPVLQVLVMTEKQTLKSALCFGFH